MQFSLKNLKSLKTSANVDHDDDQHETVLFGEDDTLLKSVSDLEDGQPEGSTEGLKDKSAPQDDLIAMCQCEEGCSKPCMSRVIDTNGSARIVIILGDRERNKWLDQIVALIDSASEKDVVDITISPNVDGVCDTIEHRSLLSAIDRCKASVITRAGALTTVGDVALWLSGDRLQYSKKMTAIFMRQPLTGYGGDIADYERHNDAALQSYREYSSYIIARGLFTKEEMDNMYETRGMLALFGKALEERVGKLKQVD